MLFNSVDACLEVDLRIYTAQQPWSELSGGVSALRQIGSWRRRRRLAELGLGAEPEPLSGGEPAAAATCPVLLIRRRTFGAAAAGYSLVSDLPQHPCTAGVPLQRSCPGTHLHNSSSLLRSSQNLAPVFWTYNLV